MSNNLIYENSKFETKKKYQKMALRRNSSLTIDSICYKEPPPK